MEPSDLEPQYDPQNEPQLDAPMGEGNNPVGGEEVDLGMGQLDQPPAQRRGLMQLLGDKRVLAGVTFVVGWMVGLFVFGWALTPLQWTDAGPQHLRADLQEDYVRMVVDSYNANENETLAVQRLNELGLERSAELLALIANNPGNQDIGKVQQLSALIGGQAGGGQIPDVGGDLITSVEGGATEPTSGGGFSTFLIACVVIAVLGVGAAGVLYFRRRSRTGDPTTIMQAQEITRSAPQTDYVALGESQPISQWMTTYLIGDDLFDDSFSIDTPAGEFMGECGVGIADTIGVGEPKRVSAFEIWLFDKNDIQTVTKVLLSEHAFNDDAIRERLTAKGDPEMSLPGHEVILETETLQMVARVVDMNYGAGALPDNSFFERMTVELAIWKKK
ncbi:MAG: hypothetical protein IH859_02020 [Chloroflexi bacterium]|nr:hypothetical protein [Chloroflexota bacterium]